ncbi:unnamed protein product [Ectocarpus sp. CCAP 1310/34]|nr:unnamed protein product [Ectocarpus sp. CCAP 1310/34]
MSQCNPLSHGILKELGKLAELKQRGLILDRHFETIKAHKDTRHLYDYCEQLELDQSARKMKLPLDNYSGDSDAAVGSWVLLESISRSGRLLNAKI